MTLPASGPISMSQMRSEIGASGTIDINNSQIRSLAGVASGPISFSQLRGKSATPPLTVSSKGDNSYNGNSYNSAGSWTFNPGVNVGGGSGGYTYSWSIVSATDNYTWSISNTTGASPNVLASYGGPVDSTCYVQCVVRDSAGHTVTSSQIACSISMG